MPDKPLVLTGFMGSGKSSVGRIVAEKLGCPLIDLDAVIVEQEARSINAIFAEEGEDFFRDRESECLERVLDAGNSVIATGGGAVVRPSNRKAMRSKGIVIHLDVSLPMVLQRLHGANDRPLFAGADSANRVKLLMEDRKQFYADADIRIDTDGKSVEDVAAEILHFVKEIHA